VSGTALAFNVHWRGKWWRTFVTQDMQAKLLPGTRASEAT
jgi:hypothetical protein